MPFLILFLAISLGYGITLEEAISVALKNNPELKSMRKAVGIYEGRVISAKAFPNPELSLESININIRKGKEKPLYSIEISQGIPLWGVREKAYKSAEKAKEAFLKQIEARERKVTGLVYKAFYDALYKKENINLLRENLSVIEELERYIKDAYQIGEATELELLRIKREKDMLTVRIEIAEAMYKVSLSKLASLLGNEIEGVEGSMDKIYPILSLRVEDLPDIKSIEEKINSVNYRIELEKALAKPTLSIGLTAEDSKAGYYEYRLLIRSNIPLFYRRAGEILENISLKESLLKKKEGLKFSIEAQLRTMKDNYEKLKRRLEYLDKETIPFAKRELDTAIEGYKERVITLFELSNIREAYYSLLKEKLDLLREIHLITGEFISYGGMAK